MFVWKRYFPFDLLDQDNGHQVPMARAKYSALYQSQIQVIRLPLLVEHIILTADMDYGAFMPSTTPWRMVGGPLDMACNSGTRGKTGQVTSQPFSLATSSRVFGLTCL